VNAGRTLIVCGSGAGLQKAHEAVLEGIRSGTGGASLPGIIFNLSKQITYTPATPPGSPRGTPRTVHAGRMECTMQVLLAHSSLSAAFHHTGTRTFALFALLHFFFFFVLALTVH
jgi:hypothetical protein